jgi:hypothetical protein
MFFERLFFNGRTGIDPILQNIFVINYANLDVTWKGWEKR